MFHTYLIVAKLFRVILLDSKGGGMNARLMRWQKRLIHFDAISLMIFMFLKLFQPRTKRSVPFKCRLQHREMHFLVVELTLIRVLARCKTEEDIMGGGGAISLLRILTWSNASVHRRFLVGAASRIPSAASEPFTSTSSCIITISEGGFMKWLMIARWSLLVINTSCSMKSHNFLLCQSLENRPHFLGPALVGGWSKENSVIFKKTIYGLVTSRYLELLLGY